MKEDQVHIRRDYINTNNSGGAINIFYGYKLIPNQQITHLRERILERKILLDETYSYD